MTEARMQHRVGIGCIALRDDPVRPVLLLRRAFGEFRDRWCFVAGHVEGGESPRRAAERELLEETGLATPVLEPVCRLRLQERDLDLHVYVARVGRASTVVLDSEHSTFAWCSFGEALERLPLEEQRRALARVRGG